VVTPPSGIAPPEAFDEPIVVYMTPWCGYCRAALTLLRDRGIEHATVDVVGNTPARRWLLELTGRHTVPQVFVHGRSIGGYTELAALERSGELHRMLSTD
jgi:glutaredoxin 3